MNAALAAPELVRHEASVSTVTNPVKKGTGVLTQTCVTLTLTHKYVTVIIDILPTYPS